MTNSVTHFEIYGDQPTALADFYRGAFGWQIEQMPDVNYWRIQTGAAAVPEMIIQVGGSISFAPHTADAKAKWLDYDTRHMLTESLEQVYEPKSRNYDED